MRLFRHITVIGLVTVLALVYVHQHVELVKLSYAIQHNEVRLAKLLDRNDRLGYNIQNLEDPSRLEKILQAQNIETFMPKRAQIVNARHPFIGSGRSDAASIAVETRSPLRIFEFLGFRAEAQADEQKPVATYTGVRTI